MTDRSSVRAILLDVEGTVAPISFVHEVLFPYARSHLETYLRRHWNDPAVAAARAMLHESAGDFSEQSLASLKAVLVALMDADVKSTGLKQLQGLIWEEGYRAGHFQSPVFPDVPSALARWKQAGLTVAIYSSGSMAAQKVFFQHTGNGDLTPYLSAFFDTTTGPKRSASSYKAIASALGTPPAGVLFISDIAEELEAASAAGMRGLIAVRPGNKPLHSGKFDQVSTFDGQF
jgi:enolase-phosphatase E1